MTKIGVFGGAFNPPHKEHVKALAFAKEKLNLSQFIVIPSFYPPHKNGAEIVDFDERYKMCVDTFPQDIVSDIEKISEQKNYTYNTVKKLLQIYQDAELYYLIGGDSMADFFKWYKPEEIIKLVTLVVYMRESRQDEALESIKKVESLGGKVIKLDYVGENISSGEIRCLSALGIDLKNYVNPKVANYIKEKDFYKSDLVDYVKSKLSDKTFAHSVRTAIWALELNRSVGLSPKLVFESAILHDIEKNSLKIEGVPQDAVDSPVAHQFSGAQTVKELGFCDEVVSSVRYHTTAKPKMSKLEMLIYSADMTEPIRDFEGVEELRAKLKESLEQGFKACLTRTVNYLKEKNRDIYYLTQDAYDYYVEKEK